MKRILTISLWIFASIGLLVTLGFSSSARKKTLLTDIDVFIERESNNYFVHEDEIIDLVKSKGFVNDSLTAQSIPINELERLLSNNPAVQKADVFVSFDGKLMIDIFQRKPIIRVFNVKGESFYIDHSGWLMPLSSKYTSNVLVANGFIEQNYAGNYKLNVNENVADSANAKTLKGLYELADFIHSNSFWSAQIAQVYVNEKKEFELIPRVGNHLILLGDADDLESKFSKLKLFYKKGLNNMGWNEYEVINLKYKNQVVCTRKN